MAVSSLGSRFSGTPLWLRLGATAVAAVVVAEGAAWLLRPRDVIEPVRAEEEAFFPARELERARDYRSGQRLILIGSLVGISCRDAWNVSGSNNKEGGN